MIADALADPLRRRNVLSRLLEAALGGAAAVFAWRFVVWWVAPIAAVLAEFLYYEFLAEPAGWTGPYFERGPRDGERFTRP